MSSDLLNPFVPLPRSTAEELDVNDLIDLVERGYSVAIEGDGKPGVAVVDLNQLEFLNRKVEDLFDYVLVSLREATDNGKRYTLDEVAQSFGFDPDELRREVDEELEL